MWNPVTQKTLEHRGVKEVKIKVDDEKKMATALLWGSIDITYGSDGNPQIGAYCHGTPMVIFKGVPGARIEHELQVHGSTMGLHTGVSQHGWINESLFLKFVNNILPGPLQNAWLILDCFRAHRTQTAQSNMKGRGYCPFFIPGGCTSLIQVHDVYINKLFKEAVSLYYGSNCLKSGSAKVGRVDVLKMVDVGIKNVKPELLRDGIVKLILHPAMNSNKNDETKQQQPQQQPQQQQQQLQQQQQQSQQPQEQQQPMQLPHEQLQQQSQQQQQEHIPSEIVSAMGSSISSSEADIGDIVKEFDLEPQADDDISDLVDDDE
jgi:hypothetical protein